MLLLNQEKTFGAWKAELSVRCLVSGGQIHLDNVTQIRGTYGGNNTFRISYLNCRYQNNLFDESDFVK